jgi:hypothetical protein
VGYTVEQHWTGAGCHVAVLAVETERHFTRVEHYTRGAQREGFLFQSVQNPGAYTLASIFRGHTHVTDAGLADGAEMQTPDAEHAVRRVDSHQMGAGVVERIPFAAAGLMPGRAQRFPA